GGPARVGTDWRALRPRRARGGRSERDDRHQSRARGDWPLQRRPPDSCTERRGTNSRGGRAMTELTLPGGATVAAPDQAAVDAAWRRVQLARHPQRPRTLDLIPRIFDDFMELHGDRGFRDDPAIVGGPALLEGRPVVVIGHQKGNDTESNIARNFGSAHPEGFRKAQRMMRLADKLGLPLITFLDTAGAFPGPAAEERGQAEAIASSIKLMTGVQVPTVVVIVGEGG